MLSHLLKYCTQICEMTVQVAHDGNLPRYRSANALYVWATGKNLSCLVEQLEYVSCIVSLKSTAKTSVKKTKMEMM